MRYIIGLFILAAIVSGCYPVPDYDSGRNPFLEDFDGSYIDDIRAVRDFDGSGDLHYDVYFRLDNEYIPYDALRVEVHVDERPDDHFFVEIFSEEDKMSELSFTDYKVVDGDTYTYRFNLGYKKQISRPSNEPFILKIEP